MDKAILAIDAATKKTGIAAFDLEGNLLGYKLISAKSTDDVLTRIQTMINELREIIEDKDIEKAVIEEVPLKKGSMATFKALFYLQGFMVQLLTEYNISYTFFEPSAWRSLCGIKNGKGVKREEAKQLDCQHVYEKFGVKANNDICDAICIGEAYFIKERKEKK